MRTKVLISVDEADLAVIDKHATKAGMSRSEYLVAMGRQGSASLFEAISHLRTELLRFEEEADPGWKAEVERLEAEVKRLTGLIEMVSSEMEVAKSVRLLLERALANFKMMPTQVSTALKTAVAGLERLERLSLYR